MTFIGHLKELRSRIIRMFLFAGLILICCLPFTNYIYAFVSSPLMELMPAGSSMIATEVASPFLAPLRVTIYTALLISVPYFFIELWGFVSPGLYQKGESFCRTINSLFNNTFLCRHCFCLLCRQPYHLEFFYFSCS